MRERILDKETGAILFKRDKESQAMEDKLEALEKKNKSLEKRLKALENLITSSDDVK